DRMSCHSRAPTPSYFGAVARFAGLAIRVRYMDSSSTNDTRVFIFQESVEAAKPFFDRWFPRRKTSLVLASAKAEREPDVDKAAHGTHRALWGKHRSVAAVEAEEQTRCAVVGRPRAECGGPLRIGTELGQACGV